MEFESLEMQKLNIATDWAQRLDDNNGVICLVTIFSYSQSYGY